MPEKPSLPNDDYTIGWIAALPIERSAAEGMLEEEHGPPLIPQGPADKNSYSLGKMGQFNIVIAVLLHSQIGASPAISVAKSMLFTFPNIRVGLMVGIGGGIPDNDGNSIGNQESMRLGDVVISSDKATGGVIACDFGRQLADGSFQQAYALNRPPESILTALSGLCARHERYDNKIPQYIEEMLGKYPQMRRLWTPPDRAEDRIFRAEYTHENNKLSCENCQASQIIDRESRDEPYPVIHYGVIATGNSVIKCPLTRENIRQRYQAICLEMEAAGLMNNFPCIVIRGISDYADSHKNDSWQRYAAATAAACAKELLEHLAPSRLGRERRAKDVIGLLSQVSDKVHEMKADVSNYGSQQHGHFNKRTEGTGRWHLESAEFKQWVEGEKPTLFCYGKPGAGKTIMTSMVIDYLLGLMRNDNKLKLAFVYFDFKRGEEQKPIHLFASMLKQMLQGETYLPESFIELFESFQETKIFPSEKLLFEHLRTAVERSSETFLVLDALDECSLNPSLLKDFLSTIFKFQAGSNLCLFATSRSIPRIVNIFEEKSSTTIHASIDDVKLYLDTNLPTDDYQQCDDPSLRGDILSVIAFRSAGMFPLAKLYCDTLSECMSPREIRNILENIPRKENDDSQSYDQAYEGAMKRIKEQRPYLADHALRILSWIACTRRPLTTLELQHALSVKKSCSNVDESHFLNVNRMIAVCAGLITVDQEGRFRLVHFTTQEYLERTWKTWFPNVHHDITSACVSYMSLDIFKKEIQLPRKDMISIRSTSRDMVNMFRKNLSNTIETFPFYMYAVQYLAYHVNKCHQEIDRGTTDEVKQLIQFIESDPSIQYMRFCKDDRIGIGNSCRALQSPTRMTRMHLAAYLGLDDILKVFIQDKAHIDDMNSHGQTPLWLAAHEGYEACVEVLLSYDANPNFEDSVGDQIPLSLASMNGHYSIASALLQRGANPNIQVHRNSHISTPLSLAIEAGHTRLVGLLLQKKADPFQRISNSYPNAFVVVVSEGNKEALELLLNCPLNANCEAYPSETDLLTRAVGRGYIDIVKLFLNRHVHVEELALFEAAHYSHREIFELLFEHIEHLTVNLRYDWGETILSCAASNRWDDVVKHLVDNGASADHSDAFGKTPLLEAIDGSHEAVTRFLLSRRDVNLNVLDNNGNTLLLRAAEAGDTAMVDLLLENGADPNVFNKRDKTPLLIAVKSGNEALISLLVENGANPNVRMGMNVTPLYYAVCAGNIAMVQLLLDAGAPPWSTHDRIDVRVFQLDNHRFSLVIALIKEALRVGICAEDIITHFFARHWSD